ncbi:MAG: hypothetical protein E7115_07865 [Bacteroidales bacterium]|nr:hypothetical protein [Bacteroidales bacterium]
MTRFFKIIAVAAIAFCAAEATADAQLLKNLLNKGKSETTETVSAGTTNGQAAGAALKALYGQYKADGKVDMSNLNNIINLATLANNIKQLKGQTDKSAFYKDFAAGLITGSNNLVTSKNSTSVMSGLTNLVNNVDLSGLTSKAASASSAASAALSGAASKADTAIDNANEIASSVTNILNLFKK